MSKVNQAANAAAVETTFQQVLGRDADPANLAAWQEQILVRRRREPY